MSTWVPDGNTRMRCTRHDHVFPKVGVCEACVADPGPREQDLEVEVDAPDPEAVTDERWCRDQRDKLVAMADGLAAERDKDGKLSRVGNSTVAKLYDVALKYHRTAAAERRRRSDHRHERWLVKQCQDLSRRGVAN